MLSRAGASPQRRPVALVRTIAAMQHWPADADLGESRQGIGEFGCGCLHESDGQRYAGDAAERTEQEAFGEELADHGSAGCAEGETDSEFAAASGGAD